MPNRREPLRAKHEDVVPRVFITGSADGLGKMATELLIAEGHQVVLHGRNKKRAKHALEAVPKAGATVIGDLASLAQTKQLPIR
jgi:NAD(P)-dependent dehydrogenase (short-subunit alcohol dehydrogenase family)